MKKIPSKILNFIETQRVLVLAVELKNNKVHAAAMLFSCKGDPFEIYFFTEGTSKKMQLLKKQGNCSASVVIGCSEELKQTIQLDGELGLLEGSELNVVKKLHYSKFPQSKDFENEETAFLKFIPNWWRHTDYHSRPPVIKP